ncbi:DUF317 domain-containing protein [Streptomyces sp. NPDC058220]|uniref:DUF317 domain-containing protein n=1 Tax=unclassified Streptomyces TaxID=2593676 RepID=UPI00364CCEA8
MDSPDGSLFLDFTPSDPAGRWWTVAHHEPYWEVRFSRQTPIEAIAAFTQALPQLIGDRRHFDRIPLTTSTLAEIADLNHWRADDGTFTSRDGRCLLRHTPGDETLWRFQHHVYDGFDTHWHASFTQDTPERLVTQPCRSRGETRPARQPHRPALDNGQPGDAGHR